MSTDGGAAALEQFCILAKTTKSRGCVALIQQALAKSTIFVFGELLSMPSLQALRGTEHEPYLTLLELFAFGTYADYQQRREGLPELDVAQTQKLRQLTIVSLAQQHESVPYGVLFEQLGLSNVRDLEDLIIETIYAGLISGRLDQREGVLRVRGAIGRDVKLQDVEAMAHKLRDWCRATETLVGQLDHTMGSLREGRASCEEERREFKEKFEKVKANVKASPHLGRLQAVGLEGLGVPGLESAYDDAEPSSSRKSGGRLKRNRMRETPSSRPRSK